MQLTKPKILVLLEITCIAGALVATKGNWDLISIPHLFLTCLGLWLTAGGANTINMWFDRDIDTLMKRTQNRPLPAGRMQPWQVLAYGIALMGAGGGLLALWVNIWASAMALCGGLFYVFIYTFWLKRSTAQNIVIGGAAGSFPPLVGWAAVQGDVAHLMPWLMFLVIFLWTPPHFWALALKANADYTRAKVPMLPVVKGEAFTKTEMMRYLLVLYPVVLAFALFPTFGWGYLLAVTAISLWWLWPSYKLLKEDGIAHAPEVFKVSIYYLALIFLALVVGTFM
jgi:protoheme IX farnesyltransferase